MVGESGGEHVSAAITVIVPTFNERDNIAELVHEIGAALDGRVAEVRP